MSDVKTVHCDKCGAPIVISTTESEALKFNIKFFCVSCLTLPIHTRVRNFNARSNMSDERCGNCYFAVADPGAGWSNGKFCRRYPTKVSKEEHDWCGEYKSMPKAAPKLDTRKPTKVQNWQE